AHVVVGAAEARPVDPAGRIVLAIGVVVAALAVADLVAGEQHRHALRQQDRAQEVAAQLPPQRDDGGVVGRTFDAAIGAVVLVGAATIALAVGLVVLALVAHQISERETVVHGYEIDAGVRRAAAAIVQIGRAGHAAGKLADLIAGAGPGAAQ